MVETLDFCVCCPSFPSLIWMAVFDFVSYSRLFLSLSHSLSVPFDSDGGGRSGVYLAIDANMELAEEEDCFHVFGYLKKLRQSRKGLIENVVSRTFRRSMKLDSEVENLHQTSSHFQMISCSSCCCFDGVPHARAIGPIQICIRYVRGAYKMRQNLVSSLGTVWTLEGKSA